MSLDSVVSSINNKTLLKGQEKQKSYWSISRKKNKPIVYKKNTRHGNRHVIIMCYVLTRRKFCKKKKKRY